MRLITNDLVCKGGWDYKAGANRTQLVIINKLGDTIAANVELDCAVKFFNEGRRKTLAISSEKSSDNVGYLFYAKGYDFTLVKGEALVWEKSTSACEGGVLALVKEGAIVEEHSYKNRRASTYYKATGGKWIETDPSEEGLVEGQSF